MFVFCDSGMNSELGGGIGEVSRAVSTNQSSKKFPNTRLCLAAVKIIINLLQLKSPHCISVVNLKTFTSFRVLNRACLPRTLFINTPRRHFQAATSRYIRNMATLDDKCRSLIQKAYPGAIQAEADMIKLSSSMFPKAEVID